MKEYPSLRSYLRSLFCAVLAVSILAGSVSADELPPPPELTSHYLDAGPAMADLNLGYQSGFTLGDVDGDGDTDALVGTNKGRLLWYRNGGGPNIGATFYRERDDNYRNNLQNIDFLFQQYESTMYSYVQPELIDANGDGKNDLFIAASDKSVQTVSDHKLVFNYYRNNGSGFYEQMTNIEASINPSIMRTLEGIRQTLQDDSINSKYELQNKEWMSFAAGDINKDNLLDVVVSYIVDTYGTKNGQTYSDFIGSEYRSAILIGKAPENTLNQPPELIANNPQQPEFLRFPAQRTYPELFDYDNDGDLDLFVGTAGGTVKLFKNNFTAGSPATVLFTEVKGPAHPLNPANAPAGLEGPDFGAYVVPEFGRLDLDEKDDFIALSTDGLTYLMNYDDSPDTKRFTWQSNPNDFLTGLDAGPRNVETDAGVGAATFADLDNDGDQDALTGGKDGIIRNFENRLIPDGVQRFVERKGAARWVPIPTNERFNPGVWGYITPVLVNLDRNYASADPQDMDFDLVFSVKASSCQSPVDPPTPGSLNQATGAAAADLAAVDSGISRNNGSGGFILCYYANEGSQSAPNYVLWNSTVQPSEDPFRLMNFNDTYPTPAFTDVDGDGLLDLLFGTATGEFKYFRNEGSENGPFFPENPTGGNPLESINRPFGAPAFADVDRDGDPDLLIGTQAGKVEYYQNQMGRTTAGDPPQEVLQYPAGPFVLQSGSGDPFEFLNTGGYAAPQLADLDNDGDGDLATGSFLNAFRYYENVAPSTPPTNLPVLRDYRYNPLAVIQPPSYQSSYQRSVNFVDFESDGDLDAFVGEGGSNSHLAYYRNVGTPGVPVFRRQPDSENPLSEVVSDTTLINVGFGDTHTEAGVDPHIYEAYIGVQMSGQSASLIAYDYDPLSGKYEAMDTQPFNSPTTWTYNYAIGPRAVLHDFDHSGLDDLVISTVEWPGKIQSHQDKSYDFYYQNNLGEEVSFRFLFPNDPLDYPNFFKQPENMFRLLNSDWNTIYPYTPRYASFCGTSTGTACNATMADPDTWWIGKVEPGGNYAEIKTVATNKFDVDSLSYALGPVSIFEDPFYKVRLPNPVLPTAADLNADGHPEAFAASANGIIHFYMGVAEAPGGARQVFLPIISK